MTDNPLVEQIEIEKVPEEEEEEGGKKSKYLLDPEVVGFRLLSLSGGFDRDKVKMLVYGDSGSGKTRFASSWPSPLIIDIDRGLASVTSKVYSVPLDPENPLDSWNELMNVLRWLESGPKKIKTVVLDSINELQVLSKNYIVEKYPSIRRAYDNLASQSDYGKLIDDVDEVLRRLKALPLNVVYTCNAAPREYEGDMIRPLMIGKNLPRTTVGMMDEVGFIYKVETGDSQGKEDAKDDKKPRVMVVDAVNHVTKDRSGVLPALIHNPSHAVLYEYWKRR